MIGLDNSTVEKTKEDMVQLHLMSGRLQSVLFYADELFHQYNQHAIITSFMRVGGVHSTGRAVDIRSRDLPSREACRQVQAKINMHFPRNDQYDTCIWHDVGEGPHFHLQVQHFSTYGG